MRRGTVEPWFVFISPAGPNEFQSWPGLARDVTRDGFEFVIVDEYLCVAVPDDVSKLTRSEALVERNQYRARERHAVMGFEQHMGVGREHRRTRAAGNAQRA